MALKHVYVPIIKGKVNDAKAVARLSDEVRDSIKPLVELMPWVEKKSSPTLAHHVDKFLNCISDNLGGCDLFVDMYGFLPGQELTPGKPALLTAFDRLAKLGHKITPTYGLARDNAVWPGLKKIVLANGRGFAFRLEREDLEDVVDETWSEIVERSAQIGVSPAVTDLIIDLKDVREADVSWLKDLVVEFLAANPQVEKFRSVVVVGSSALKTVTAVASDGESAIVRNELFLWTLLKRDISEGINLLFGDYGVVHPYFSDGGNAKYMNAKVRYTAGLRIHYLRGHGLNHPTKDYGQYRKLAAKVCKKPFYKGAGFSFGDGYIDDCAKSITKTPGSPQTWVLAEMNHHVAYSAAQMVKLSVIVMAIPEAELINALESA